MLLCNSPSIFDACVKRPHRHHSKTAIYDALDSNTQCNRNNIIIKHVQMVHTITFSFKYARGAYVRCQGGPDALRFDMCVWLFERSAYNLLIGQSARGS